MQPAPSWEERAPQSGARTRVADLYAQHGAYVVRLLWLYRVPPSDRDDVAQAVWLAAHRRAESLDPGVSARAWLAGIVRRCAADARRSERRRSHVIELQEVDQMASSVECERWYEALELLERAVPDEPTREAFVLHASGLTACEVADILKTSPSSVEWSCKVARKGLTAELKRTRSASVVVPFLSLAMVTDILQAPPVDHARPVVEASQAAVIARPAAQWISRFGLGLRAAVVAGAFGLGVVIGAREPSQARFEPASPPSAAPVASSSTSVDEGQVLVVLPPPPSPAAVPSSAPLSSASTVARSASTSEPATLADVLLARARVALASSPGDSLRALDEHARRWPRRHAAERDVIAVRALLALGRRTEAEARATAALRVSSSYRSALEAALGHALP